MPYTTAQLLAAYVAAEGAPPDAAMQARLDALAARTRNGELDDAAALACVLVRADVISAVASEILRFFNGDRRPRQIDVNPVAEAIGEAARTSPYSVANRLIGFAAELGVGPWRRAFAEVYGAMDYPAFVGAVYERLIGAEAARAAGYDAGAAIADTVGRYDSFLGLVKGQGALGRKTGAEDEDLAVKAGTVGYLLAEAIKWDFGVCARRAEAETRALIAGEAA
jgi:hypothetical protein